MIRAFLLSWSSMENTILITRVIDAPCGRVYKAFLDPEDLVHWSHAGDGWVTPYARVDAKPGGEFHIGYRSGDGAHEFDFTGTYDELVEGEKIVYTIADGRKVWIAFSEELGKTRVDLRLTLETENPADLQRRGWGEHLVNLEAYLTKA